jgi:hypothetical protein
MPDEDIWPIVRSIEAAVERCRAENALARRTVRVLALKRTLQEAVAGLPPDRRDKVLARLAELFPADLRIDPQAVRSANLLVSSTGLPIVRLPKPPEPPRPSDPARTVGPKAEATLPPDGPAPVMMGIPPELVIQLRDFAVQADELVSKLWQSFNGREGEEISLPGFATGLDELLTNAAERQEPELVRKVGVYLDELRGRLVAALGAYRKAGGEWGRSLLDRISPKTVAAKVDAEQGALWKRLGLSERDYWQAYKTLAEGFSPEQVDFEIDQLAARTAQELFKPSPCRSEIRQTPATKL